MGVILRKILVLPKVNVISLKLNFDQITIVNSEIIGVAQATKGVMPLIILIIEIGRDQTSIKSP